MRRNDYPKNSHEYKWKSSQYPTAKSYSSQETRPDPNSVRSKLSVA